MTTIPPPFPNQLETANFISAHKTIADFSDPGTGKTRAHIEGFKKSNGAKRLLAIAPLSILRPSWGADIEQFAPELNYRIAHGSPQKRKDAFLDYTADVVIMNHDGVNWLLENQHLLDGFSHLDVDESTAFKNPTAKRTKALQKLLHYFEYRSPMSGTPHPKNILDIWAQMFIADYGQRLGVSFYKFRNELCKEVTQSEYVAGKEKKFKTWVPQDGAEDYIALLISDIVIRHKLENMPNNESLTYYLEMPRWLRTAYNDFLEHQIYLSDSNDLIVAKHKAIVRTKVRQLLSGALYNEDKLVKVHDDRTSLVLDLATQVEHSVIGFNFRHERERLELQAKARNIGYAYIDGTVPEKARHEIWKNYQNGEYDTIFLHPQAAAHGLTFTRGQRVVWHSPPENLEHYIQLNRRIYRAGQTKETQFVRVAYQDTIEQEIYDVTLNEKAKSQDQSLGIFDLVTQSRR